MVFNLTWSDLPVLVTLSHFGRRTEYRFLYANPSSYLNSPNTVSVSDVSCLFEAIDTNDDGMQIL